MTPQESRFRNQMKRAREGLQERIDRISHQHLIEIDMRCGVCKKVSSDLYKFKAGKYCMDCYEKLTVKAPSVASIKKRIGAKPRLFNHLNEK